MSNDDSFNRRETMALGVMEIIEGASKLITLGSWGGPDWTIRYVIRRYKAKAEARSKARGVTQ